SMPRAVTSRSMLISLFSRSSPSAETRAIDPPAEVVKSREPSRATFRPLEIGSSRDTKFVSDAQAEDAERRERGISPLQSAATLEARGDRLGEIVLLTLRIVRPASGPPPQVGRLLAAIPRCRAWLLTAHGR